MNAEDLYGILGVSRNADEAEIKKQYRKLCLTHHPDKGGDEEKFKKIQKAYEVLGDDKRRKMYDQMGIVDENESGGMPFGGGGGVDLGSIFANMFGSGFNPFDQAPNMPGRMKRHKPQPKVHEIPVSLYDFYYGKQIKIQFERQKFCLSCKGEGFSSFKTCNSCNGQGFVQQAVMIGPGMFATSRGPCESCNGKTKTGITKCSECNGKKFFTQEKVLEVSIKPGMKKGDNLVFSNECSDDPNFMEPGDVHIFFTDADETLDITRNENDLSAKCIINLKDSLLGTTFTVKDHPKYQNGFEVKIPKGTINNDTIVVQNEGMPRKHTSGFGNFNLTVQVVVSDEEKTQLELHSEDIKKVFTSEEQT